MKFLSSLFSFFRKNDVLNGISFLLIFGFLQIFYRYSFFAVEQSQLFFFDWDFFLRFISVPGNLAVYATLFLTQFFYLPFVGALCTALILWGIFLSGKALLQDFGLRKGLYSAGFLLPVLLLSFFDINDMLLPLSFCLFLNLNLARLCMHQKENRKAYGVLFIASVFSYILSGGFLWWMSGLVLISLWGKKGKLKHKLGLSIFFISISLLVAILWSSIQVNLPIWLFFFNIIPYPYNTPLYFYNIDFTIVWINYFIYIGLLFFWIIPFFALLPTWKSAVWIRPTFLIGVWILYLSSLLYFYPLTNSLLAKWDTLVNREEWNELLADCDQYWEKTKDEGRIFGKKPDDVTDYWAASYTKLGLIMTHQLNQRYFSYIFLPQMAPLFLNKDRVDTYFFTRFLSLMGDTVGVLHYATLDQSSTWRFSPTITKLLVVGNARVGNYQAAKIPLARLKKTLHYRDFAKQYENPDMYAKTSWSDENFNLKRDTMMLKRYSIIRNGEGVTIQETDSSKMGQIQASAFLPGIIDARISELALADPKNRLAAEYLFGLALLKKDIPFIFGSLPILRDLGYNQIPIHIEEATLIALNYNQAGSPYNSRTILGSEFYGFGIRQETLRRFDRFINQHNMLTSGRISNEDFKNEFGKTFWFYYLFGEPTF